MMRHDYNPGKARLMPYNQPVIETDRSPERIMDSNNKAYTESDLLKLEGQIDELIATVTQLKAENSSLRHQQDSLMAERSQLIEKTELARSRVEAMITRLRSLELNS
jgi:cell division protein ZapB